MQAFFCHDKNEHVVCSAPPRCYSQCKKYGAKTVKNVEYRDFSTADGIKIRLYCGIITETNETVAAI